jgi:hypothetical protein
MSHAAAEPQSYGLLAEFDSAKALLDAAHAVRRAGYTQTDAFSPMPIHGLAEALGFEEHIIPKVVLGAGITGLIAGYGLEYWSSVIAYPLNILFAALSCFGSLIFLCGLPQPYHPVFNAKRFKHASSDAFFLVIEAKDPKFDAGATKTFLEGLHAKEVVNVDE